MDDDDDGDKIRLKLRPYPPLKIMRDYFFFSLKTLKFFFLNWTKQKEFIYMIPRYDLQSLLFVPFFCIVTGCFTVAFLFLPYLSIVFSSWNCYFCYSFTNISKWQTSIYFTKTSEIIPQKVKLPTTGPRRNIITIKPFLTQIH